MAKNGIAGQQGTKRESLNKPTSHASPAASSTRPSTLPAPTAGTSGTRTKAVTNAAKLQTAATSDMKKASAMLMDEKRIQILNNNISMLDAFINHQYMADLRNCQVLPMEDIPSDRSSICIYELTKLMLSDVEDTYEKLVSLYASLYGMRSTVGLILDSDGSIVHVYLCTSCNDNNVSAGLLKSSVMGHFPGSKLESIGDKQRDRLLTSIQRMPVKNASGNRTDKHIRTVSIVPSRREDEKDNNNIKLSAQGIEKFIDGMIGKKYTVMFIAEPIEQEVIDNCKHGFESLFSLLSPFAKETVSYSENESDATNFSLSVNMSDSISEGISNSFGTSHTKGVSGGRGGNSGFSSNSGTSSNGSSSGFGFSSGSCWNSGWNSSDTTTKNITDTKTRTKTKGDGEVSGDSHTTGMSRTINVTREIKTVQNCMQRLEAEMQRIETNRSFGMWNCCCYVISEDEELTYMASSSLQSLFCGDAAYGGQSHANSWSCIAKENASRNMLTYLSYLRHPWLKYSAPADSSLEDQIIAPSMMVSGRDLPTLLSLPQRSVPGVQVMSMAEFGRNFPRDFNPKRPMMFGNVMHMGNIEATRMRFDLDRFSSHCFICGASGSGKSNTTYNLLEEFHTNGIPFLVIEPAKGEYKTEFAGMPGMQVFTCKPDGFRMLSINPFEFHKDVHIKEHLAHLNSVVSTCWPLYGPMPAMLKDAFEEAYISCGWDLELSQRIVKVGRKFPTFAEVLPAIEKIIDESTYSGEEKGNYKGALCMRIKMLMNGFEGQIFGNAEGIPDSELFDQNAVVDLSSLGNPETRSLIMGVLIVRLREYRYAKQTTLNSGLKHITVLEEAHNILKRCSHESSQDSGNVQGASVGMLVDCIAEMRSCGEGFMIIDQSPGAVDEAALKNTAIKIVMRLPEKNDCEAIGSTLSLKENQIIELSRFDKGVAAVFHEGWEETVLGKMGTIWAKTPQAAKYHIVPTPVDRTELIRTKGAVCQWLCSKYVEDDMEELENMRAFDSFMSVYKAAKYAPSVNDNLWKDIRQQISQFLNEIKENLDVELGDLDIDAKIKFREYLGQFLRRFLQIDGIFRLNGLKLSEYEAEHERKPTNKQLHEVKQWWERMKDILSYYMILPVECGVRPLRWTTDTLNGQYFEFIFKMIVKSYGDEYLRSHPGMSIYRCAYRLLDSTFLPDPKR